MFRCNKSNKIRESRCLNLAIRPGQLTINIKKSEKKKLRSEFGFKVGQCQTGELCHLDGTTPKAESRVTLKEYPGLLKPKKKL